MFFISFLLAFCIFLLAISLINLFLSFAIRIVTNNKLDEYKFIVPSVLYLIINGLTFLLIYLVDINILDLSIRESIMALIFKTIDISDKIKTLVALDLILLTISIIIQSICLMTVNIDYTVTIGKIRMFFKGIYKKIKSNKKSDKASEEIETTSENVQPENVESDEISNLAAVIPEGEMAENKEILKLSFGNAIICTIFIFAFLFFMFMALFTVGSIISSKIL